MGPQRQRGRVGELFPADKEREIKRGGEREREVDYAKPQKGSLQICHNQISDSYFVTTGPLNFLDLCKAKVHSFGPH